MRKKRNTNDIRNFFIDRESFNTDDVFKYFSKIKPGINRSTVLWRIYELVQQGIFQRTGRGVYSIGKERSFLPMPQQKFIKIAFKLNEKFPLAKYCAWHTSALIEFYQHITTNNFILIEIEKDAVTSVFHFLKEIYKNTFKQPTREIFEEFVLNTKNAIIVKPLISEAPLTSASSVPLPTLEKILVDLLADKETFYFLQGNELLTIFNNAIDKYTVNIDKLMRYAKRRNKDMEIQNILKQINGKSGK